jgi:hypothetical protein
MSSSLSLYLLDPAATRALVGCRDEGLLRTVRERCGAELEREDEYFRYEIGNGAPTSYEALRAVINGGPFGADEWVAFPYGYAYQRLCAHRGRFLDNSWFSPFRGDWLSTVDAGLKARGVTAVSVAEFSYPGLPSPLPRLDTPGCGTWTAEQCVAAVEQAEGPEQGVELDSEVSSAVAQCVGWARQAAREGLGVVGFRF